MTYGIVQPPFFKSSSRQSYRCHNGALVSQDADAHLSENVLLNPRSRMLLMGASRVLTEQPTSLANRKLQDLASSPPTATTPAAADLTRVRDLSLLQPVVFFASMLNCLELFTAIHVCTM